MNEAGKTVFLEALAKMNYFDADDLKFKFDITHDYPRKELVKFQRDTTDVEVVKCTYVVSDSLVQLLEKQLGKGVIAFRSFSRSFKYKSKTYYFEGITVNHSKYLEHLSTKYSVPNEQKEQLLAVKSLDEVDQIETSSPSLKQVQAEIADLIKNSFSWADKLAGHVAKQISLHYLPKFWYFDEYYQLDGRININDLKAGLIDAEKAQTAKALLNIAGISIDDLLTADDYENFIAQLEAASNEITDQIFKYWRSNQNLDLEFKIDKIQKERPRKVQIQNPHYPHNVHTETVQDVYSEIVLDIRVRSQQHKISLPLHRRSKGFNWFFSFVVWFSTIKNNSASNYILLLDEPGLNLHALAQANLLRFFEDLSQQYQLLYSTHSPFMIDTGQLNRVRTVVESSEGSVVSQTLQEKDPNTLFPLQAALGYDIAQNLFISKNNLLVEGPADLLYLTTLSALLEANNRTGLKDKITIVPVGGLDKVAAFISLLRGSNLNVVCLLDSFSDQKGKQRVDDLVAQKIIKEKHIRFFDEFSGNGSNRADIEDLFAKEDYLKLFNAAFDKEYPTVEQSKLTSNIPQIILQINKIIQKDRFNHYKPAYKLVQLAVTAEFFAKETLDRFEKMFKEINKLF